MGAAKQIDNRRPGGWRVLIHDGLEKGDWEERFRGPGDEAKEIYFDEKSILRLGGICLVDNRGRQVSTMWVPRNMRVKL